MELWIPITITAAFLQNLRTAAQKKLQGSLGTMGASFVRFGFGFPVAILYVLGLHFLLGKPIPEMSYQFPFWALVGGVAQIAATIVLVHMFTLRNFAVGTAYSKTEPVQAALFGFVILGERLTSGAVWAIIVGVIGVMLISVARTPLSWRSLASALFGKTALTGILSGALFGISAVAYRSAALSLGGDDRMMQAALALAVATTLQTIIMVIWIALRDPTEFGRVKRAWRSSSVVGLASVVGSACWFTAMAMQPVAYVRALGQIELIFTFATSVFVFKEKINAMEIAGCLLIVSGILLLLSNA
ncbi:MULTISPECIES: DMT family transporter [Mesorhizobium]|uniref:DMT family transporter n=1 Tax=Mesorhizobium denitrificans TaxID=2294114 RepID=A0A371XK52_9HYPH|nr:MULTISPECIES: DMT family transporter [Mesorhizobium]RFC69608.1 DMT family transporter [Mesorhizobium denitrificans]